CLPPLRNSSRQRYNVCSEIPARRAIRAAGSSLLNNRNTIWARCSVVKVDFFPISPLLLQDNESITYLRVQRKRSYTLRDLARVAGGTPRNSKFASFVAGKDSLSITCRVEPAEFHEKCEEIVEEYKKT